MKGSDSTKRIYLISAILARHTTTLTYFLRTESHRSAQHGHLICPLGETSNSKNKPMFSFVLMSFCQQLILRLGSRTVLRTFSVSYFPLSVSLFRTRLDIYLHVCNVNSAVLICVLSYLFNMCVDAYAKN